MSFLIFVIISVPFWERFRDAFWFVFGYTFGAVGGQKVAKMLSKIDVILGNEKSRFRGGPRALEYPRLVAGGLPPILAG